MYNVSRLIIHHVVIITIPPAKKSIVGHQLEKKCQLRWRAEGNHDHLLFDYGFLAENQPSNSMDLLGHPLLISVKMIREGRHPIFTATMAGDRLVKCCAYHARQTWLLNIRCCTYDIDEDTRLHCGATCDVDRWCWTYDTYFLLELLLLVARDARRNAKQCSATQPVRHSTKNQTPTQMSWGTGNDSFWKETWSFWPLILRHAHIWTKKRQRTTYNTNKHMAVCQNLLPPFDPWLSMGFLTNEIPPKIFWVLRRWLSLGHDQSLGSHRPLLAEGGKLLMVLQYLDDLWG